MKKILWLEDDRSTIIKFGEIISSISPQHLIVEVENAQKATEYLKDNVYDQIIIDLRINWGLVNDNNFLGTKILELVLKGFVTIGTNKYVSKKIMLPEAVWILTAYEHLKSETIKLGLISDHYILKGDDRKTKFVSRLLEVLHNE